LGEEQSGHIREVGFELYQQMLEDEIARLKAGGTEVLLDDGDWSPQINLGVPVLIPDSFVPDLDVRLGLYRRLSSLTTKVELEGFAAELIDRFGKLPKEVNTLLQVVRIKGLCRKAGIGQLDIGPKGATIRFRGDKFASPGGLVEFLQAMKGQAKLKENRIVVSVSFGSEAERIKGGLALARQLADLADAGRPARVDA
jgi:transcription-repair coupling factor (superfamily II helicase)